VVPLQNGVEASSQLAAVLGAEHVLGGKFIDSLAPNATTSLQRDIADGKPSEIDFWNGSVVRQGQAAEVPTPVNQFIYHSVLPQELRARGKVVFPQ
jgi:2-dehydropantoate 2-reductase